MIRCLRTVSLLSPSLSSIRFHGFRLPIPPPSPTLDSSPDTLLASAGDDRRIQADQTTGESLTGLLNHTTSQLQKLADRAERINEWLDMDLIVLQRLTIDAKNPATHLSLTSSTSAPLPLSPANTAPITDKILELNNRVAAMQGWRKDLERAVFWQREEYRRIEKAMGRKRSGQSGALRNVGFDEKAKGDLADTPENRARLQELDEMLQAGIKLPGEEQADGVGVGVERVALRPRDYARDRWTSGSSRLPNQSEWEDIFGPKVSWLFLVAENGVADDGRADSFEEVEW